MPRYLVERTFAAAWVAAPGATSAAHAQQGVTWIHSYVAPDRCRSYCLVDGPSPEAVRLAARAGDLPADRITEVWHFDPSSIA